MKKDFQLEGTDEVEIFRNIKDVTEHNIKGDFSKDFYNVKEIKVNGKKINKKYHKSILGQILQGVK